MQALHNPPHLNYYRLLERDLEQCFRFVEPKADQFGVYSDEFARIILMAASEIENALKAFAFWLRVKGGAAEAEPRNILEFYRVVTAAFPSFCTMSVFMPRQSLLLTPWEDWSVTSAPDWWSNGYNKIKHDRINNESAPTLRRAIYAVGALQVVLLHYYRVRYPGGMIADRGIPEVIVPWDERNAEWGNASTLWDWHLPDDPPDEVAAQG